MPIFEAEVRGKTSSEDQLTSRVFGALTILDKQTVLIPFLTKLATDDPLGRRVKEFELLGKKINSLSAKEIESLDVTLWQYCGDSYPDVYINIGSLNWLLAIEVKENSKATIKQLKTQYRDIRGISNKVTYFLLTDDENEPEEVKQVEKELSSLGAKIYWRKWKQIWKWLRAIIEEQYLDGVSRNLVEDIIRLLGEGKRMKYATGLKREWFGEDIGKTLENLRKLSSEISIIIRELNQKIKEEDLVPMMPMPCPGGEYSKPKLENPEDWVPNSFEFTYKDKRWRKIKKPQDELYLYISFRPEKSKVSVGFYKGNRHTDEQLEEVSRKIGEKENLELYTEDKLLDVGYDLPINQLQDENVVDRLLEKLVDMRDFANRLKTFRSALGLISKPQ